VSADKGRVRLVVVAAITASMVFSACSAGERRPTTSSLQPVPHSASSARGSTITPRSKRAHSSVVAPIPLVMRDRVDDVLRTQVGRRDHPERVSYSQADLRQVMISHGSRTVDVVAKFGDLRPRSLQLFEVQLRTPGRTYYGDGVLTRGHPTVLSLQWEFRYLGNTLTFSCAGASGRANFVRDRLFITVPTHCFGAPPWVRVNVWNTVIAPGGAAYEDGLDEIVSKRRTTRGYQR
jgi:hypothetical protein